MLNGRTVHAGNPNSSKYECAMYSPASFETAYVQRASPTEPPLVTCVSSTRYACVPKTSLVEKSTRRASDDCVACAVSSTLYVPIRLTRMVRTGLSSTASTPAIAAQWTMCVTPAARSRTRSASRTSPCANVKFGWSASSVPDSASRWRLSSATISFASMSLRASVVPMKPAPPVIRKRFPCRATRRVYPRLQHSPVAELPRTERARARLAVSGPALALVEAPRPCIRFHDPEQGLGCSALAHRSEGRLQQGLGDAGTPCVRHDEQVPELARLRFADTNRFTDDHA